MIDSAQPFLPLKPDVFEILLAQAEEELHCLTPLGLSVVRSEATRIVELAQSRSVQKLAEVRHA